MIVQKESEPRVEYLARVLYWVMENTPAGEITVEYDEATCDGMCLAHDLIHELGIDEGDIQ